MSLNILTDKVTAVFALGEWHPVVKGTFEIDAYQVEQDFGANFKDIYEMGQMYPEMPKTDVPSEPGTIGEHWRFKSPQGCSGCVWRCPDSGQLVAMSILEIKAWRYGSE